MGAGREMLLREQRQVQETPTRNQWSKMKDLIVSVKVWQKQKLGSIGDRSYEAECLFSLVCIVICLCYTAGPQQGCGGYLTSSNSTFSSPDSNSDGRYDKSLNCIWFITAPVNKQIRLTFNTFVLETESPRRGCVYDYVKVSLSCFLKGSTNPRIYYTRFQFL